MARSPVPHPADGLTVYQHDEAATFRFVLVGRLAGGDVDELEHAWTTARSVMRDKEMIVEFAAVTGMDAAGADLLARMQAAGARMLSGAEPGNPGRAAALRAAWRRWFRPRGYRRLFQDPTRAQSL